MPRIVAAAIAAVEASPVRNVADVLAADQLARAAAREAVARLSSQGSH